MADQQELRLVVTTVADTQGATQTRDALRQVRQEAQQAAVSPRVEFANDLVRQITQAHGSSADAFRRAQETVSKSTGVAPTLTASDLGISTEVIEKAKQNGKAITEVAQAHRAAAAGAKEHAETHDRLAGGFKLSEFGAIRFAASLAGLGIGLSIASQAGQTLHDVFVGSIQAAADAERQVRALGAAYGASSAQAVLFSESLSRQAGIAGSSVREALVQARPLTTQFGLSDDQSQQLIKRSADLAAAYGQPFEQTFQRVLAGVGQGGDQLATYGVRLDDVFVKTVAYNGALSGTFDNMTKVQQAAVRFQLVMSQTTDSQGKAAANSNTLSGALDRLGAAGQRALENIGQSGGVAEKAVTGVANAVDDLGLRLSRFQNLPSLADIVSGNGLKGPDPFGLFTTSDPSVIRRPLGSNGAAPFSGPEQRKLLDERIAGSAPQPPPAPVAFIGPPAQRPQDLAVFRAQEAIVFAQRAQVEAQARITALNTTQQLRQLAAAKSIADLRTETLGREGEIVSLQRQEADLADRITLASRNSLDLVREQAQAKLNALPASEALGDNAFEQRRLLLQIQATRADVRRGALDPSALADIPAQRQQIRDLLRQAPRLELNAVEAARPGELLERQATREQLQQTIKLSTLQQQQRVLEDQLIPLRAAQRLTDERTSAINRQLELQTLGETAARTQASYQLLAAQTLGTAADLAAIKAAEWASNINDGLSNIQKAWTALQAIPLPNPPVPPEGLVNPDRPHPPPPQTPGAGTRGNTFNVNVTFTGPVNDAQAVAQAVLTVLNNAVDSAPQAPPVGLAGAIG